jgi:hypothetical protein
MMVDLALRTTLVLGHELIQKVLHASLEVLFRPGEVSEGGEVPDVFGLDLLLEKVLLVQEQNHARLHEEDVVADVFEQLQGFDLKIKKIRIKTTNLIWKILTILLVEASSKSF